MILGARNGVKGRVGITLSSSTEPWLPFWRRFGSLRIPGDVTDSPRDYREWFAPLPFGGVVSIWWNP